MTDSHARPADDGGDVTIPIVPEGGYAPTEQLPFTEETRVDPAGTGGLWSADSGLDLSAPGYGGTSGGQPPAPTAPAGYPPPSAYTQTNYTQPQAGYGQTGYGQPAPQPNYVQPQVSPSQQSPYQSAPSRGFAEPSGPADTVGSQNIYQGYPTAPAGQQPAWPAVIQDPVAYDYGYGYNNPANHAPHPNAMLSMVLGILGLAVFQLLSPVAWYLAAKGRREMATFPGRWRPSGALTAGLVMGIIGTVIMGLVAVIVVFAVLALVVSGGR